MDTVLRGHSNIPRAIKNHDPEMAIGGEVAMPASAIVGMRHGRISLGLGR
jgi:hypothetical protein